MDNILAYVITSDADFAVTVPIATDNHALCANVRNFQAGVQMEEQEQSMLPLFDALNELGTKSPVRNRVMELARKRIQGAAIQAGNIAVGGLNMVRR